MTYSIVARDPRTGQMGVAVQSHYFSVGPICPWASAGVGAVATQSLVDPSYGPLGLELMGAGRSAAATLEGLLAADEGRDVRQVAMVDKDGTVAAHTGPKCIAEAGHRIGDNYSVQANMMLNNTVWDAMAEAYEAATGDLAGRMMDALDAAEAEGGDIRGRQSAAILIVKPEGTGRVWADRVMEIRVEDHPEPLQELRRLIGLRRAYDRSDEAEQEMGSDPAAGADRFKEAVSASPDNIELRFWYAANMAASGRVDEARPILDSVYAVNENWRELLRRLPASGLFPDDPQLMEKLTS